jgi:CRP-like cAMP-binding protein
MGNQQPFGASMRAGSDIGPDRIRPAGEGASVRLDSCDSNGRNRLLATLPNADRALLAPHLKDVTLEPGAVLQEPGEPIVDVYFPCDETATVGREGAIGSLSGLGPRRSHTRALVQVAGRACRISASQFRSAADRSQPIRDIIVRYGEMLLIQVQQTAACNALHDVEERLSRWLLQARDRVDGNIIRLTHEFLSQMLGVRRPTVTVVARMLQDAGLIRYHRGHIEIVDRPGLEARACECYHSIRQELDAVIPTAKGQT